MAKQIEETDFTGKIGTWMLPGNPNVGYSGVWKKGYVPYQAPNIAPTVPTEPVAPIISAPKTEEERLKAEIERIKGEIEKITPTYKKAMTWLEKYPGAKPTEEIPEWVLAAETPEEVAAMVKPKRIEELEKLAFAPPTKTWDEVYTEAYNTAGLGDIKKQISDLDTKITKTKDDLYTAEGEINENPWLSEAGRVGRVKKLYDAAQKDIKNLVEQRKTLVDEYNTGIKSAGDAADRALKGWESQGKLYQAELKYLTESGKDEVLSVSDAKALKVPYGTTKAEAMEKGIVPAATAKEWTEFSDQEKRKLTAAGIDWTTPEGYADATNYLYPPKEVISQSTLNKLATSGIPNNLALDMQEMYGKGYNDEQIRNALKDAGYDPKLVDTFKDIMGKAGEAIVVIQK